MQVRYDLYLLNKMEIPDATGIIEYPELRETVRVEFDDSLIEEIENAISAITKINVGNCPGLLARNKVQELLL
ncbi:MAG: Dna2/Cas4 domain-containing protein [Cyclobacteriaceae bacterium]|nr:Dna2/Cas4 domain-containing protein [Cyclobacteriaceae bacterium]